MIVPARRAALETLARGGATRALFEGREVATLSGYDVDATKMRGYRRAALSGAHVYRPGAYSPRVTRVGINHDAPSTVGTTIVLGGIDALKERNLLYGVAGSRAAYGRHVPRKVGMSGYISVTETPAYGIIETSYARTGVPVLFSKFASPRGTVPNGMTRFDPIPAYTRVPLGSIVPPPTPVGCLPGTPGCFTAPGGVLPPGLRRPWGAAQNQGQAQAAIYSPLYSPLAQAPSQTGSPLAPAPMTPITLPIYAPGTIHSVNASTGDPSYTTEPGYPRYTSPWGYQGASRTDAQAPMPSGHDVPIADAFRRLTRAQVGTAAVLGAFVVGGLVLSRRRRRRR